MTCIPENRKCLVVRQAMLLCTTMLVLSACGGDDGGGNNNTLECGPNTGNAAISGNITVGYSASIAGSGTVTSITYAIDGGEVVVNNPTLPWQANVNNVISPAAIRASGTVTTGTITIGYSAVGAPNRAEQDTATCSQINQ